MYLCTFYQKILYFCILGIYKPDFMRIINHVLDVYKRQAEQHGDIFLSDYVSLAEHRVLCNSFYYLGYVVAQHAAHGVLCSDKLHVFLPLTSCFRYFHL